MALFRLPNGTWIDPSYVLAVEAVEESDLTGGGFVAPRVIIHLRGDRRWIECASLEAAERMRDEIAGLVNSNGKPAKEEPSQP